MIIKRKKNAFYINLFSGISFLFLVLIGFATLEEKGGFTLHYYFWCIIGVCNIIMGFYCWKTPLIKLGKNEITFYSFPNTKKTHQTDDLMVTYNVGDYVFKTGKDNIYRITKSNIPKDQLAVFEEYVIDLMAEHADSKSQSIIY